MKFLIGLFHLHALRGAGNGLLAPAQRSLQPNVRGQRRSRIDAASDVNAPARLKHINRLGKHFAYKSRRQAAQLDGSRDAAGQQIIHRRCSARRAGRRHIQPARIHRNRKHVLLLARDIGNFAIERKKSPRVRLQAVAVHHRGGAGHHAIKMEKDSQPSPCVRHRKVAAINKELLPRLRRPSAPGEIGHSVRQCHASRPFVVVAGIEGRSGRFACEEPIPIEAEYSLCGAACLCAPGFRCGPVHAGRRRRQRGGRRTNLHEFSA